MCGDAAYLVDVQVTLRRARDVGWSNFEGA